MSQATYNRYQEGLIKTLLASPDDLQEIANMISNDDFSDEKLKLVYESLLSLNRDSKQISLVGIIQEINETSPEVHLDPQWILSLDSDTTKWVAEAPPKSWAKLLKREAARYKTENVLNEAKKNVGTKDPIDLINNISYQIERIALDATDTVDETLANQVDRYKEYMKTRLDIKEHIIPSPYPSVDKHTVGWLPGQLITIGARTSVGKSVIATQSAITACVSNKSVALFSLEMSEFEVMDRMLSTMSMVELSAIRTRPLDAEENARFSSATERLAGFKLNIDDTANVSIDYIRNKAIRMAQSPAGLDMIIIDYLQLITNNGRAGTSRQENVAEISRSMKILAKQLNVPIMVLVQLNRESKEEAEDRLPKISDIRESGAIAADSDVILLIDRKLTADEIDPKALFIIGKNRNGQPGKKISVRCGLEYAMFIDEPQDDSFAPNPDGENEQGYSSEENHYEQSAFGNEGEAFGSPFGSDATPFPSSEFGSQFDGDDESPFGEGEF